MSGRPSPQADTRLRLVTLADAALLDTWAADPVTRGEFNDFGLPAGTSAADRIGAAERAGRSVNEMIVEVGGRPVGHVSWYTTHWGPNDRSAACAIGISLVPEARGRGIGTRAQRMAADYLFRTTRIHRVEASTDIENHAEQRALDKAGFFREGVIRQAQWRAGAFHDLVLYSRLRTDPPPGT